jgi:transcriptional regulator with XRE-family HTH domain
VNRARQIRLDRGLTLSAVSEATGVSRLAIRRVEDELRTSEPQAPTLKAIGDFYGVPASSLLLPAVERDEAAA